MSNRKSYARFRLVPKLSILDDLERTWTANTHSGAEKMRLLGITAQIWIKIDPYYQPQQCGPMTLVSENIKCMCTFAGGLKWEWGCRRLQFLAIWVTTFSEIWDIRPAMLYGHMLSLVDLWLIAKWSKNDHGHGVVTFYLSLRASETLPLLCSSTPLFPTRPRLLQISPCFLSRWMAFGLQRAKVLG